MLLAQLDSPQISEPDLHCEFYNPVVWDASTPPATKQETWNWKNIDCKEIATTKIASGTDIFYLSSKIDYTDIFLSGFIIFLAGVIIFKFIWDFIHPKIVKVKTLQDL